MTAWFSFKPPRGERCCKVGSSRPFGFYAMALERSSIRSLVCRYKPMILIDNVNHVHPLEILDWKRQRGRSFLGFALLHIGPRLR